MKQCDKFINVYRLLGEDWKLNAELIVALECFICHLHRHKDTDINKVREKIFDRKFLLGIKGNGSIIVGTLPSTLYLYILHSNYVARIWKCYLLSVVMCLSIVEKG